MKSTKTSALLGSSSLCFVLLLSGAAFGQSSNSQTSSPAEQEQTQQLNQGISDANKAVDEQSDRDNAQYGAEQQRYREQLRQYRRRVKNYEEKADHYEASRDRYVASHARYHRTAWPRRYEHRLIVDTRDLLGARVHTSSGRAVGHVVEVAMASGRVDALRVTLDRGRGDVWIEAADLRFDSGRKVVMTNLDRRDLYEMSRDAY